jgi:hypothetical protein
MPTNLFVEQHPVALEERQSGKEIERLKKG